MILYYNIFLYNYPKNYISQIKVVFYGTETENYICSTFSAHLDVLLNKKMKCCQVNNFMTHFAIIHLAISFVIYT